MILYGGVHVNSNTEGTQKIVQIIWFLNYSNFFKAPIHCDFEVCVVTGEYLSQYTT